MSEQQPTAFFSYARWDDDHDDGYLSEFRQRLAAEVQAQTGNEFLIFQDQIDVAWGQDWQQRITESLDETVFFIPVITPTFFTRPACRQELTLVLQREKSQGRGGLILPVYYISSPLLDDEAERAHDPLAQALASRQRADWRKLRFASFEGRKVQTALVNLASQLADALRRSRTPGPVNTPIPSPSSGPTEEATNAQPAQAPASVSDHEQACLLVQKPAFEPAGVASDEGSAQSFINIGVAHGQMGDLNAAMALFTRALAVDPANAYTHVAVGVAIAELGDLHGAFAHFAQASALDPRSGMACNCLGVALAQTGDLNGAIQQFHQAIAVDPAFGKSYNNLGLTLRRMGNEMGAIQQYRQAAALDPGSADALIDIGVALGQMGDVNGAFERFREAIALDPACAKTHNTLGMALWQVGDANGAVQHFRQAIAIDPSFAEVRNNLGIALKQMGDLFGAAQQFQQVIAAETARANGQPIIHP